VETIQRRLAVKPRDAAEAVVGGLGVGHAADL
jgi:hypothetical protein